MNENEKGQACGTVFIAAVLAVILFGIIGLLTMIGHNNTKPTPQPVVNQWVDDEEMGWFTRNFILGLP